MISCGCTFNKRGIKFMIKYVKVNAIKMFENFNFFRKKVQKIVFFNLKIFNNGNFLNYILSYLGYLRARS